MCEVQSYVYGAKREIAEAAEALGRSEQADKLRHEAETLKRHFKRRSGARKFARTR